MGNEVEFGKQEGYKGMKKEEFSREWDVEKTKRNLSILHNQKER
jgi:hypothetical protein